MKSRVGEFGIYLMVIMLPVLFASCSSPSLPGDIAIDEEIVNDKPTIPENVEEGMEYLYDFRFADRYDANIMDDFSLVMPDSASPIPGLFFFV